ncbi:MAG: hypothetical protein ACHQ1G_11760, partial [Planctomycetota bacterium]
TYVAQGQRRSVDVDVAEEPVYTYGIEVRDLEAARARTLGLPPGTQGVEVTRIQEGSVADQRDEANRLLPGDVILQVRWAGNGARIESQESFERVMRLLGEWRVPTILFLVATKDGYFRVTLELKEQRS